MRGQEPLTNAPAHSARSALQRQLRLAQRGRSMLHPFIGRSRRFQVWQHYPRHDAIDDSGRWQFYFHAHEALAVEPLSDARQSPPAEPTEHGHIHLFRRDARGRLSHLTGLSLDARGTPLYWFAPNQWVTDEHWLPAEELTRGLDQIELRLSGPLAGAALWLADMVRVYAAPLRAMLHARDAALEQYCAKHQIKRNSAWVDRRVSIWSSHPLHWPHDALQLAGQFSSSSH